MKVSSCPHLATPSFGFVGATVRRRQRHKRFRNNRASKQTNWGEPSSYSEVLDTSRIVSVSVESNTSKKHVHFAPVPTSEPRHVSFATEGPTIHECPNSDFDPADIWYNAEEYDFLKANMVTDTQACTDKTALAWLQALGRAYRNLNRDPTQRPIWRQRFANVQQEETLPDVEPWFLGLEQYILASITLRESRRRRLSRGLTRTQGQPNQQRSISEKESSAVVQWNIYIATCITESVQQDMSLE